MAINSHNCCSLSSALANRTIGKRKLPVYVVLLSLIAATGGLMFGYDIGISGGVIVMDDFLCKFFPSVLASKINKGLNDTKTDCAKIHNIKIRDAGSTESLYCLYGNQKIQFFTSSLYLAAMVATFFAAIVSRRHGRKVTMLIAGIFFDVGVILNSTAGSVHGTQASLSMLICGRIMLGFGVGFGNQAVPLFLSEIAPAEARGSLNNLFQLNVTIGILVASIVNLEAERIHPWGWRLSLGLAGVPAVLLTVGSLLIVETPNSLAHRGLHANAELVLKRLRGDGYDARGALEELVGVSYDPLENLDPNLNPNINSNLNENINPKFTPSPDITSQINPTIDSNLNHNINPNFSPSINTRLKPNVNPGIINAASIHHSHDHHITTRRNRGLFGNLLARSNRPPLIISIAVQFFQQFTGINVIILYSPVLFKTFGTKTRGSLYSALLIGAVNVLCTFVSIVLVDRLGRRALLLEASLQMFVAQVLVGIILIGTGEDQTLPTWRAIVVLVCVCVFVSAFAWSWGPLAWLISTEIFPLMSRSEGQSLTVFFNMFFTFLIAHTTLTMLCHMKFAIFFFFAGWAVAMGALTNLFLPETMNMEIEVMGTIWSYHWFWKRFVTPPPHVQMTRMTSNDSV